MPHCEVCLSHQVSKKRLPCGAKDPPSQGQPFSPFHSVLPNPHSFGELFRINQAERAASLAQCYSTQEVLQLVSNFKSSHLSLSIFQIIIQNLRHFFLLTTSSRTRPGKSGLSGTFYNSKEYTIVSFCFNHYLTKKM